jgi:glycerate dehydrogenase
MNNVDLAYAKEKGIVVKNVAGYSTKSVAQTTFSMLFYLLQKLKTFDDFVKSGDYAKSPIFTHIEDFYEINGKKWGIIGMGEIGQEVAKIATAFGAEVLYYSTSGKNNDQPYKRVELDDLLRTSHIVSIHAPLNEKTHNLINEENLSLLQKDAVLINVGRGGIINEYDLAKALKNEHFYAALDVLTSEPMREDSPFYGIQSNRLFITPHIAWTSREARESLMQGVYENIKEFMDEI